MAVKEPEFIRQWQPASTFSSTERFWKRRIVWKVRAMPSLTIRWVSQFVMSLPSKRTSPLSERWFPVMRLNTVVLPAPFGTDEPDDGPLLHVEGDFVYGHQSAEGLRQVLKGQQAHGFPPALRASGIA